MEKVMTTKVVETQQDSHTYCVHGCLGSTYGVPLNPAEMPLSRLSTTTSSSGSSPALMFDETLPSSIQPNHWCMYLTYHTYSQYAHNA